MTKRFTRIWGKNRNKNPDQVGAFCFFEKLRERRTKRRHCTSGANLGRLGAIHSVVHKNEFLNPLTGKNLARGRKQPPPGFHGLLRLISRNCEDKRNDVARRVVHKSNASAESLRREVGNRKNADFGLLTDEERTLVFVVETFVNESFRPFEMRGKCLAHVRRAARHGSLVLRGDFICLFFALYFPNPQHFLLSFVSVNPGL